MKLLRFGFEGEVIPQEVTITQGLNSTPKGVQGTAITRKKSSYPTEHRWAGDNPGDQGSYINFRQDYTNLSKWPGAYVFETGREGIPGSKAIEDGGLMMDMAYHIMMPQEEWGRNDLTVHVHYMIMILLK